MGKGPLKCHPANDELALAEKTGKRRWPDVENRSGTAAMGFLAAHGAPEF